ncbi:hypothetical protein [Streptomyces chilikensis]|uniref:hypothetical protein n=1 Tax=Streptomyces chilikensis TaxID=1194079 RepID=UPI00140E2327|nr:hypothetical protein [Streptomyces chilikensis]
MSTTQSPQSPQSPRSPRPDGTARPAGRAGRTPPRLRRAGTGLALAALVLAVAAVLDVDDGPLLKIVLAVVCGTAALVVQHLAGLSRQLAEQARESRETRVALDGTVTAVRESLERHAADLRGAAEKRAAAPAPPEGPVEAVAYRVERATPDSIPEQSRRAIAEVLTTGPDILQTFARAELERVVRHMADLNNLTAECAGENHDWMLSLTHSTERSIFATSTSVDREFWNSEPASRYLQAQREAIERGVVVQRLFLLESAEMLDDKLLRLCEEQELLGIELRAAVMQELPPHLQRGTTSDFILYDEGVSFEIEQDLRDVNVKTRLIARPDHVEQRLRRFRELWEAGMNLRDLETRVDDEEDGAWMVDV